MSEVELFEKDMVIGIFRGFSEGGLEFHADLVLPYRADFQNTPMHGLFLLVQLQSEREAVLGRIASFRSEGRLVSAEGEDYGIRAVREDRPVPAELREQYLKYRVNIRVLGVVRVQPKEGKDELIFAPSHRRLPHVGSKVARLSPEVLRRLVGHYDSGAELGFFTLGEFVYAGRDSRMPPEDWMRVQDATVIPRFQIQHMVARRSFIFARAGYGKSNLNKLLFSNLYGQPERPSIEKGPVQVPVGTVLFDPEGEYFWPDDRGRPGLCDVPQLEDRLVLFTSRRHEAPFYNGFIGGEVKVDLRKLKPGDVVSIALSPEKQDQQNVQKLKALSQHAWASLIEEISKSGNQTDLQIVMEHLQIDDKRGELEAVAARSNLTRVVNMLHDPQSEIMDNLLSALADGCLCVVDVSQLRGDAAFILSGIILQRIFDHNQEHFTSSSKSTIPVLAVVEEAQSVLGSRSTSSAMRPYVEWVKEGRKYDLGAVLITQQPGAINDEILSQGDNWFVFHLLSARDLQTLQSANAHFSQDLLSSLLNEPIKGNCIFWSSESPHPFPIPVRILDFNNLYRVRDPQGTSAPGRTWARTSSTRATPSALPRRRPEESSLEDRDPYRDAQRAAIEALKSNKTFMERLKRGAKWGAVMYKLSEQLPRHWSDRKQQAYHLVVPFMEASFGKQGAGWYTEKSDGVAWIRVGAKRS